MEDFSMLKKALRQSPNKQKKSAKTHVKKNVHHLLPSLKKQLPSGKTADVCVI